MNTSSVAADSIPARDFRAIFLWPLRLKPGIPELKENARHNDKCSSAQWLGKYADWICSNSNNVWIDSGHYRDHNFRDPKPSAESRYAEFVYFHPFIQKFLYGDPFADPAKPPSIRMLHRTDIRTARVQLHKDGPFLNFPVERIQLILFPSDVAILAVQLNQPTLPPGCHPFSLADAEDFLDWGRRVYPPFWSKPAEPGKVPHSMCWCDRAGKTVGHPSDFATINPDNPGIPVVAHWKSLVQPLTPSGGGLNFEQVEDERIPTLAFLAVDHPELVSKPDMVRLAFLDDRGSPNAYPYSRNFLSNFESEYCYDRFWGSRSTEDGAVRAPGEGTTRMFCTDYSFVMLGQSASFFTSHLSVHFEQHYFVLALIAHMQKASLLSFWDRLATVVHAFEQEQPSANSRHRFFEHLKWLLVDIADFTSRFWFTEVSNQLQAQELFDLWSKHLKTRQLFQQVTEQTSLVRDVQSIQWQAQAETLAAVAVLATLVTTFAAVVVALPGAAEVLTAPFGLGRDQKPSPLQFTALLGGIALVITEISWGAMKLWQYHRTGRW